MDQYKKRVSTILHGKDQYGEVRDEFEVFFDSWEKVDKWIREEKISLEEATELYSYCYAETQNAHFLFLKFILELDNNPQSSSELASQLLADGLVPRPYDVRVALPKMRKVVRDFLLSGNTLAASSLMQYYWFLRNDAENFAHERFTETEIRLLELYNSKVTHESRLPVPARQATPREAIGDDSHLSAFCTLPKKYRPMMLKHHSNRILIGGYSGAVAMVDAASADVVMKDGVSYGVADIGVLQEAFVVLSHSNRKGSYNTQVSAYSLVDGEKLWHHNIPGKRTESLLICENSLLVAAWDDEEALVYRIDPSGSILWKAMFPTRNAYGALTLRPFEQQLLIGTGLGWLYSLDYEGHVLWEVDLRPRKADYRRSKTASVFLNCMRVAVERDGFFFVASHNKIWKIAADGSVKDKFVIDAKELGIEIPSLSMTIDENGVAQGEGDDASWVEHVSDLQLVGNTLIASLSGVILHLSVDLEVVLMREQNNSHIILGEGASGMYWQDFRRELNERNPYQSYTFLQVMRPDDEGPKIDFKEYVLPQDIRITEERVYALYTRRIDSCRVLDAFDSHTGERLWSQEIGDRKALLSWDGNFGVVAVENELFRVIE